MGRKINTIMQTCFFAISKILPIDEAIKNIKESIKKTYGKKSDLIVSMNYEAVDNALKNLYKVDVNSQKIDSNITIKPILKGEVTKKLSAYQGDSVPVSKLPADGTWPSGTTQYEKRNVGLEVPVWDPDTCIQCNECVTVCPHAVIRANVFDKSLLKDAPEGFLHAKAKGKEFGENDVYNISVSVEDCTGCSLCVEVCPAKNKSQTNLKAINMNPQLPLRESGAKIWDFFTSLPTLNRDIVKHESAKEAQFLEPLFEFSGACPGCGETPYIKLATQLFGDRMIVANATGCSSIYGGFEDNGEFGLGFRLAIKKLSSDKAKELLGVSEYLVKKSVWIIGGDGWAYDIGYGGLDHVLASGKNVNILVLDTQVYSNTGGQQSKATPTGAVAKFAAGGKSAAPKDLAAMAVSLWAQIVWQLPRHLWKQKLMTEFPSSLHILNALLMGMI